MLIEVLAARVFAIKLRKKTRESFIQPKVPPVLARDEIAEPLVSEFVGDNACAHPKSSPLIREGVFAYGRGAHPLHAPAVIVHGSLGVLGPGILHPRDVGKE